MTSKGLMRGILPEGTRVRVSTREDAEALLALYCEVHDKHRDGMPDDFGLLSPEAEARLLKDFREADSSTMLVAEAVKGLIGCVRSQSRERLRKRRLYVDMLAVSPKWQRRGVGSALMLEVEARARALGCVEIELDVYDFNVAGLDLYGRLGYETVSRRLKRRLTACDTASGTRNTSDA